MAETDIDLPKAVVKRIMKAKLAQVAGEDKDYSVTKDALTACSESAKVFISFVAATANDICKDSKRQTISAEDVLRALRETDFEEFEAPLREYLQAYKQAAKEKASKKKEGKEEKDHARKRKSSPLIDEDSDSPAAGQQQADEQDADGGEQNADNAEEGEGVSADERDQMES